MKSPFAWTTDPNRKQGFKTSYKAAARRRAIRNESNALRYGVRAKLMLAHQWLEAGNRNRGYKVNAAT